MKRRTMRHIPLPLRGVDTDKAARLAVDDWPEFCALVVADATAAVRPEVTAWLESRDGLRSWCDGLRCALGAARLAQAWARYNRDDDRLEKGTDRIAALERRLATAGQMWEESRKPAPIVDPDEKARGRLTKLICRREMGGRIGKQLAASGLDPDRFEVPDDPALVVPWAERHGWLRPARDEDVDELLDMDDAEFRDAVVDDVLEVDGRDHGLRRLLVLDRWRCALLELRDATVLREDLRLNRHAELLPIPNGAFTWPEDDFDQLVSARRFVDGISARLAEQQHRFLDARERAHRRMSTSPERVAARNAVTQVVVDRHPEVLAAIRAALEPYVTSAGVLGSLYLADPGKASLEATDAGRRVLETVTQGRVA